MTASSQSFEPASCDDRPLRAALGRFATGVTVVTCQTEDGPLGITANSFASVSLDPPLVLWSPAKGSARFPFFAAADRYAIHVLGAEQAELCRAFARNGDSFGRFAWRESAGGVPLLENCLARFECDKVAEHEGGDHVIVVGRVTRVTTRPGAPLLFFGGAYGAFSAED
ncbi:flavin reductase family protein [Litorisediminicola beolgyonensis]|uniref:Flavin reductase family protein n=1 Tax=Litorisediminicola beolgyonensis TaxID=1173614 RepID=A0ABW3ZFY5_9RHOB